jgi:hypothetical protein
MQPFSIVPASHFGRRPRVRLAVRHDARPFAPNWINAAWAVGSLLFLLATLCVGLGA